MRRVEPNLYTKKYYLTEATGYNEFKKSWGKILEPRLERIVKEIPSVRNKKILDIGCGRGEIAFWSAEGGAKEVYGIDYSKEAIKLSNKAKKRFPTKIQRKIEFKVGDAKYLKFKSNYFDIVILTEVLEHLYPEEQSLVLKEIYRVLKRNGCLFIHTAPNKWFNNFTYKFWCYPVSSILVKFNNLITRGNYGNLEKPSKIRNYYHKIMHVNEPDYFTLKKLFAKSNFRGWIKSTNITVNKPVMSWKDVFYNFIVYLTPISNYFPFDILWGNDFISVLYKI